MVVSSRFTHQGVTGLQYGYHPLVKPKLLVYLYHVDGLLIDTGQHKMACHILRDTNAFSLDKIFITHHHEDHSGNIAAIQSNHRCEVFGSAACAKLMKDPPKISRAQKFVWGDRPAFEHIQPVEGILKTKNHSFQLIPIPGHAADMTALYEPDKKWVFSADLFINSYIGYFLDNESIAEQISSIKEILKLDFHVLFCSHNPKLIGGREALEKKLRYLETSFEAIADLRGQGLNADQIFQQLALKEMWFIRLLSGGMLSKKNMVHAVLRDLAQ